MVSFTTKQLFMLITSDVKWYEGYCDANAARVMKHRHNKGTLTQESYEALFFHHGYKKELIWTK